MKKTIRQRSQAWLRPAICALVLAGTVGASAQNTNPTNTFDTAASTTSFVQWWGTATMTWDGTKDVANDSASGSVQYAAPFVGSLGEQFMTHFTIANRWGWDGGYVLDASTYTNFSFDIKIDSSSGVTTNGAGYGPLELGLTYVANGTNYWQTLYLPTYSIPLSATSWTHVDRPLTPSLTGIDAVTGYFFKMWSNGSHTNTLTFNIDNVMLTKPTGPVVIPPPTLALQKAGPTGVQITADLDGQQWQRDAISSPEGSSVLWSEAGGAPVTYSFTIADFPDPVSHEGFETHLFLVNGDTVSAGDQTYGGCDWNAADIAVMSVFSITNNGGGYICEFSWKTNLANANPPDDALHRPGRITNSTILGTWSITFTDKTNVTMTAPGGASTNFFIPEEAVNNNFSPATSFLQFGFHKNDNENNGHNNGVSGTLSQVKKVGGSFVFDDSFTGPSLTSNYAWRKTSSTAVNHVPVGTAWWLNWTKPAISYFPQSATNIEGPWTDLVYSSTYATSSKVYVGIPASGGNNYYRMIKRPFTQLQVLLPGESNAPNTPSGKTGTPVDQAVGLPFNVTVNACDSVWRIVSSSDTINITSSDASATLPADAPLVSGIANYAVQFNASGSWTVTATNMTDGLKLPNTSSPVTAQ